MACEKYCRLATLVHSALNGRSWMAGKEREAGGIQRCISYVNTGEMSWTRFFCRLPCTFGNVRELQRVSKEVGSQCWSHSRRLRQVVPLTVLPLCGDMLSAFLFPHLTEAVQAENVFCSLCISVTTSINENLNRNELLVFIAPLANSAFLKEVPIISYGVLIKASNL